MHCVRKLRTFSATAAVAATVLLAAGSGEARPRRDKLKHAVALVVTAEGTDSQQEALRVVRVLRDMASLHPKLHLVDAELLRQRLRGKPEQLVLRCGTDSRCLGQLARKARSGRLLAGRIRSLPGKPARARLDFTVVEGVGRPKLRRIGLVYSSADDLIANVSGKYALLFGSALPAGSERTLAGTLMPEPELVPLPGVPGAGDPTVGRAASHTPAQSSPGEAYPGATPARSGDIGAVAEPDSHSVARRAEGGDPEPTSGGEQEPGVDSLDDVDPIAGALMTSMSVDGEAGEDAPWLLYGGGALAGVGAVLGCVGGYFGLQYRSMKRDIEAINGGVDRTTTQRDALSLQDAANDAGRRATTLGIIGAAAAVVGGVVAGLHLADFEAGPGPAVAADIRDGRMRLSVAVGW